jgi:hypothetical protein
MGWVNSWVSGTDRGWAVPVAAALLMGYAVWNLIRGAIDHRKKRKLKADAARAES